MGIIQALGLGFEYQKYREDSETPETVRALNGVDLDVEPGEFIAILGHNGSGKSTLAKHINALLVPTKGTMWVDGIDTKSEDDLWRVRQKAGMVFQNPDNQIIGTIVEEDVGFGPENLGLPTEKIWERVNDALVKVGMEKHRDKSPNRLSGGQKQRVAIAGVVAMHPDCIVLDEPTAMLDPNGRQEVLKVVRELNEKEHVTVILITHYMEEVVHADRVFVMDHGKVVTDTDEFGNDVLRDTDGDGVGDEPIYLVKPTIEKIAFTVADNDTCIEQLAEEELHLINKITYDETIQKGFALRGEEGCQAQNYPRIGLSFLTFTYEWPTVNDMEVRQAIAYCMDREGLTQKYCGGNGLVMDGYFGLEQWEYQLVTGRINYPVNFLPSIDALGTKITEAEEEENKRKKKMKFMYYETDAEYEACIAAWDMLRQRWQDDEGNTLLVHYTVDLDEANRLLDKCGWVLNKEGNAYKAGVDDVRCKKLGDEIVPLELKMMYPKGNHMIEFMQEEGMFLDNLNAVGIKLEFVPEPMEELLRYYYREKERTTDMIYLATNFHVIVDPSITYSTDDTVGHKVWNNTYSDDKALFDDAVSMRKTEPGSYYEYVEKWMTFQERYNTVLPTIPIYSNIYYDFYSNYLQNYNITNNVTWSQAIIPAYFGLPEVEEEPEEGEEELGEGEMSFGD